MGSRIKGTKSTPKTTGMSDRPAPQTFVQLMDKTLPVMPLKSI